MIKLELTLDEAILLRDAIADKKCGLSTENGVVKNVDTFTGSRKDMILNCIDLKNLLDSKVKLATRKR